MWVTDSRIDKIIRSDADDTKCIGHTDFVVVI